MTISAPVERAQTLLAEGGFKLLAPPIAVAGIPFAFSAMLVAEDLLDLIVLIDTVEDGPEEDIRREVDGLGRALDVAQSRRPLSVILIGPRWSELTERAMGRVARVLVCDVVVGDNAETALRDALAVLLPLELTLAPEEPAESWISVRKQLEARVGDADMAPLLAAAPKGEKSVERELRHFLAEPLKLEKDA